MTRLDPLVGVLSFWPALKSFVSFMLMKCHHNPQFQLELLDDVKQFPITKSYVFM